MSRHAADDAPRKPRRLRPGDTVAYAFDRCRVEEPPLFDVGPGQQAACWLAEGGRSLPVLPPRDLGAVVEPGIAAPIVAGSVDAGPIGTAPVGTAPVDGPPAAVG